VSHTSDMKLEDHLVATLASTAHLCPLPERKKPIYWEHDQALYLYPLPDALILGDQYNYFATTFDGMHFFNPGTFSNNFHFYDYEPFLGNVTESEIPVMVH